MSSRYSAKILLATLIGLLLISSAASVDLDPKGDNIVWLDSEKNIDEVFAKCDSGIQKIQTENGTEIVGDVNSNNITLDTSDFKESGVNVSQKNLEIYCIEGNSGSFDESLPMDFGKVNFELNDVSEDPSAIVGTVFEEGLDATYNIQGISDSNFDLSTWDLSFNDGLSLDADRASYETESLEGSKDKIIFSPVVKSYPEDLQSLRLKVSDRNFRSTYPVKNLFVHEWSINDFGDSNPGREMDYSEVQSGEYEYLFDISYIPDGQPNQLIENRDFILNIEKRGEDGDYESYNDEPLRIFEDDNPSSDANYRVYIDDYSELEDLEPGTYRFNLEVEYTPTAQNFTESRDIHVDSTRIDKRKGFTGVVSDSTGNGVVSEIELDGSRSRHVFTTDSSGAFSEELAGTTYDVKASFFATSGERSSPPDAEYSLDNVDLSNADLRPGASPIRFDYMDNPEIGIEGLNPVNIMMTKFAYPMDGVDEMEVSFDAGSVNPSEVKLFECDEWVFAAQECGGSWSQVDESDMTVNAAPTFTVNVENVDLYQVEDDSSDPILMNAYVIGSNSRIELQDAIDVPDLSVQSGGTLEASGVLIDENGDRVEDADVTLSLMGTDKEWSATSDSTGSFQFEEELEGVDKGNYQLRLEASKPPYESLERESSATVEVYYEKSIRVDSESEPLIPPGERYDINYNIENNGQTSVEDLEFDVSGVNRNRYELNPSSIESLDSGDTTTVELTLDPPEEFQTPPSIEFGATGVAGGEEVQGSATTLVSFDESSQETENTTDENQSTSSTESDNTGMTEDITRATGDFIQSQSDMNLALGLILVFGMILAVAVRKRKNEGNGRDDRMNGGRMGSRPVSSGGRVQKPDVSPKKVEPESGSGEEEGSSSLDDSDEKSEESRSEDSDESGQEDEGDEGDFVCDTCGESFDTESGLNLHTQALH